MTDAVSPAVPGVPSETMFRTENRGRESDPSAFLDVLDQGLSRLASRPDMRSEADTIVEGLQSSYAGEVGHAKSEIVGGELARAERSTEANNVTLEDRIKGLYTELTHYQVAWKIAQNVQRDISQVLRGS